MKPFEILTGNLQLEEKEVKGQKKQYVKGLITTDDKDLVNDIVTQKCMDSMVNQLKDRTMKLDFEHETFSGKTEQEMEINKTKIPLGKRVDWQRKSDGIEVEWELNPTWKQINSKGEIITKYDDIIYNLKNGFYDGFSIAYYPTKTDTKQVKGEDVRLLDDVNLLNVALTGNPVNQKATLTEIMAKSRDYAEKQEDEKEEKSHSNLNESEHSSEKKLKKQEGKMAEEEKSQEQTQPKETSESQEKPEEKSESQEKPEEKSDKVAEVKSEIKSLKDSQESLKKEIEEVKSLIKEPQRKSIQEGKSEQKSEEANSDEPKRPLDLIR